MRQETSVIEAIGAKRRKMPKALRKQQVLALQVSGLTQDQIATKLGVSRRSIVRDLEDLKPARQGVTDLLTELQTEYAKLQTPDEIAWNYVDLSENATNEAVRLAAQDRILEHRDVVTEKERRRTEKSAPPANQAMFILAPGMNISFGPSSMSTDLKSVPLSEGTELKDVTNREVNEGGTVNKDEEH